jgi:hypothetical protein
LSYATQKEPSYKTLTSEKDITFNGRQAMLSEGNEDLSTSDKKFKFNNAAIAMLLDNDTIGLIYSDVLTEPSENGEAIFNGDALDVLNSIAISSKGPAAGLIGALTEIGKEDTIKLAQLEANINITAGEFPSEVSLETTDLTKGNVVQVVVSNADVYWTGNIKEDVSSDSPLFHVYYVSGSGNKAWKIPTHGKSLSVVFERETGPTIGGKLRVNVLNNGNVVMGSDERDGVVDLGTGFYSTANVLRDSSREEIRKGYK